MSIEMKRFFEDNDVIGTVFNEVKTAVDAGSLKNKILDIFDQHYGEKDDCDLITNAIIAMLRKEGIIR